MGDAVFFRLGNRLEKLFSFMPAVLVAAGIAAAGIYADRVNQERFHSDLRLSVSDRLARLRAHLEGTINNDARLVEGLVATVAIEPDMTQEKFAALASRLFETRTNLRNIGAAPDMVVRMMFPVAGNEPAIGLDYNGNPSQREAAERAHDLGELILAGPVDLVQGGRGLIARFPVFLSQESGARGEFWGLVSAVIDIQRLYDTSGLLDPDLPIEVVIKGSDALGDRGSVFFGREEILAADPVLSEVTLPHGYWRLAAIPKGGWPATPPNMWWVRLIFIGGGVLIVGPVLLIGWLLCERRKNLRRLSASNAELRSFAHVVSHDLQSPLNNVINFVGLAKRGLPTLPPDRVVQYLDFAGASASQGSRLVRDLLEYSRVTSNRLVVAEIDVALAADIALNNLKSEIDASGAQIRVGPLPRLRADETQLVRLLQNLIGNAIKYRRSDAPPEIDLTARRDGEGWRVSVSDNGIGIPPDKREEVFQAFKRLHADAEIQGSGIGLSVCKHVVERHGGRIWVDAADAAGSVFSFTLPDAV